MKLVLEVKENKADFFMQLIRNFPFVKVYKENGKKKEVLKGIEEGLNEVKLVEQGKLKSRSAKIFLDEL